MSNVTHKWRLEAGKNGNKDEYVYEDFDRDKEMLAFSNYSTKSKSYDDFNKLMVGKIKYETAGAVINNFLNWSQRCIHFL